MSSSSAFKIYDASAGSGKTYTLARSYLRRILESTNPNTFKHMLAITFTHKAVGEMKTRIIDMLSLFSKFEIGSEPHPMFSELSETLNISHSELKKRAKDTLYYILHNYGGFDISTIDGFTHRVIRTFAYDLKLPVNFEVETKVDDLLNKAVDNLIAKAGTDQKLTNLLVAFAIEKADDDKSWDISYDFNKIAKLLIDANSQESVKALKDKSLADFDCLKSEIIKQTKSLESEIIKTAESALEKIASADLQFEDFAGGSRAYLPNYFLKLSQLILTINYEAGWALSLREKSLYPASKSEDTKASIDAIAEDLISAFEQTKQDVSQLKFQKAIYKNIVPLSVLSAIQNEVELIKLDENKILISEFNTLIGNEIKDQPTPFIYERLGEKFRHYFIDEFQDTSVSQWQNLVPLLDNAISSTYGSTMLLGDAKQSIYRWRGGKAEQFMDIIDGTAQPFQVMPELEPLDTNYRSFKAVVDFNNDLFSFLAQHFFETDSYANLYRKAKQQKRIEKEGFVALEFLDFADKTEEFEVNPVRVLEIIDDCQDKGFKLGDICVLIRKKKEGVAIAEHLSANDIPIISSETLLLSNAKSVQFLIAFLRFLNQPEEPNHKLQLAYFLADSFKIENKHQFLKIIVDSDTNHIFELLKEHNIHLSFEALLQTNLFELSEAILRAFGFMEKADAYVQGILEMVLEFNQKQLSTLNDFLDYYDEQKDSASIVSPENQDAVRIMTIHKSKGLEFPVVIFPFANQNIYEDIEAKAWHPLDAETYCGFDEFLLNLNKDFESFGDIGKAIYDRRQAELRLDSINLLYVTLTRAVEQLYVLAKHDVSSKGVVSDKSYSGWLIRFLQHSGLWNDSQMNYTFGDSTKVSDYKEEVSNTVLLDEFVSSNKADHKLDIATNAGRLWDSEQQEAKAYGTLIHDMMAEIVTIEDLDKTIQKFLNKGEFKSEDSDTFKLTLKKIITHPDLSSYFSKDYDIYNERDIFSEDGIILRPDRLVISSKEAVLIDYKTGQDKVEHKSQLDAYTTTIEKMGYSVKHKILVYVSDEIEIVHF
ncbi:UvrD-helicase domain-containing protein [Winogradskyella maritima]|uniref:DNA 3'-5' helicase n=1 Tax=Winogradskyella maritima TaxID=1517766 RepID=A0ABV8AF39_9FLAO|nr:UvrD-helicase domain-containing protein [Winogradskyella maritima]